MISRNLSDKLTFKYNVQKDYKNKDSCLYRNNIVLYHNLLRLVLSILLPLSHNYNYVYKRHIIDQNGF